ncbi:hypothetical protein ACWERI_31890 [Streptomyces collinus]
MHMQRRKRVLRFSAVLVLVVLALTGFSTGRGRGHHYRSGHGSGGGCSSSHQDHDETSSSYRRSYGSSSRTTSSGSAGTSPSPSAYLDDATVRLLSCATKRDPYTKVQVTNPNATGATFSVTVHLKDRSDQDVDFDDLDVTVPARGSRTARIPVDKADLPRLDHCEPGPNAPAAR